MEWKRDVFSRFNPIDLVQVTAISIVYAQNPATVVLRFFRKRKTCPRWLNRNSVRLITAAKPQAIMPRNAKSRRRGMLFRSLSFLLIRSSFRNPSIGPRFNSKCCSIAQYPAAVRRFVQLKLLATGIDRKNALGAVVGRRWWTRLDQYWAPAVGTRCLVHSASRRFLVSLKQTWEKERTNGRMRKIFEEMVGVELRKNWRISTMTMQSQYFAHLNGSVWTLRDILSRAQTSSPLVLCNHHISWTSNQLSYTSKHDFEGPLGEYDAAIRLNLVKMIIPWKYCTTNVILTGYRKNGSLRVGWT